MFQSNNYQHGLTVLITTYNAASLIEKTLEHLQTMRTIPNLPWEVLVVDNNSKDDTLSLVKKVWKGRTELRIVCEKRQGTGFAQFTGMQQARYSYIGIVDQDNWVDEDWMEKGVTYLDQNPRAGLVCGKGTPVFEKAEPPWFKVYQQNFAVGPQHDSNGVIQNQNHLLYSAGSIFRKAAFDELVGYGFNPLMRSRSGHSLLSGDDSELEILLRMIGWEIHYMDDLNFQHYMPAHRLTRRYFIKLRRGLGATAVYLDLYRSYPKSRFGDIKSASNDWRSLLIRSFARVIRDPIALIASLLPNYEANFRVAKLWAEEGQFFERLACGSSLQETRNQLFAWLDSLPMRK